MSASLEGLDKIGGVFALFYGYIQFLEFSNGFRDKLQDDLRKELMILCGSPETTVSAFAHFRSYCKSLEADWKGAQWVTLGALIVTLVVGCVMWWDQPAHLWSLQFPFVWIWIVVCVIILIAHVRNWLRDRKTIGETIRQFDSNRASRKKPAQPAS